MVRDTPRSARSGPPAARLVDSASLASGRRLFEPCARARYRGSSPTTTSALPRFRAARRSGSAILSLPTTPRLVPSWLFAALAFLPSSSQLPRRLPLLNRLPFRCLSRPSRGPFSESHPDTTAGSVFRLLPPPRAPAATSSRALRLATTSYPDITRHGSRGALGARTLLGSRTLLPLRLVNPHLSPAHGRGTAARPPRLIPALPLFPPARHSRSGFLPSPTTPRRVDSSPSVTFPFLPSSFLMTRRLPGSMPLAF